MEHQGRVVAQQKGQLKAASEAFKAQQHEVASLKAAVMSPRGQARWGMFAGEPERDEPMDAGGESRHQEVLIAGGSMPLAPVYRGCTKKEKREFMDRYLSYQRHVEAMNECTGRRIALMPLGACVEHRAMTRILMFELKRPMREVTKEKRLEYFAPARAPTATDYDTVEAAIRTLKMDVSSRDPESRVLKLISEFQERVEGNDMETFLFEEPKLCIKMLCKALQTATLRDTVKKELKKETNRRLKGDVSVFVDWLAGMVAFFTKFETSMPRQTVGGGQEKLTGNTPTGNRGKDRGRNRDRKNKDHAVGGVVTDSAGTASGNP